jgi:TM2 domain-containing membrane protein YozV
MANCTNCGAVLAPGAGKCGYCGAAAPMSAPAMPPAAPYAPQPMAPVPMAGADQKSKVVAGILAILIGTLGIHNFYLGYTGKAVAQLLITLLTCGYGSVITFVWGVIEGIMILTGSIATDARGVPLKD